MRTDGPGRRGDPQREGTHRPLEPAAGMPARRHCDCTRQTRGISAALLEARPRRSRRQLPGLAGSARAATTARWAATHGGPAAPDCPDRWPIARSSPGGPRFRHDALREPTPAPPGVSPVGDERRVAHLDPRLPAGGDVRGQTGHPGLSLLRSAATRRRLLPAGWRRRACGGHSGRRSVRDPERRKQPRLRLLRRRAARRLHVGHALAPDRPGNPECRLELGGARLGACEGGMAFHRRGRPRRAPVVSPSRPRARAGLALVTAPPGVLDLATPALYPGRLRRAVCGRSRHQRQLCRLRRVRPGLRPAPSPRPAGPP
jgi:hypothetical protein